MTKITNEMLRQCRERQEQETVGRVVFGPAPGSNDKRQQAVARLAVDSTIEIDRLRARCEHLEAALRGLLPKKDVASVLLFPAHPAVVAARKALAEK